MNAPESRRIRYRFGEFVLDPCTREVRRDGELLTVAPKAFDCIAYLVANRHRAVGHDELTAAVWGRADVTDTQLRQLMRKVRRILGDDGEQQAVVRTITHFGFHWVAATASEDTNLLPQATESGHAALAGTVRSNGAMPKRKMGQHPASGWRLATYASFLCALAALGGGALVWNRGHDSRRPVNGPVAPNRTVGVLPMEIDPRGEADTAWMPLGLMDFVAVQLRKASVSVVASSDVLALSRNEPEGGSLAERVRQVTGASGIVRSSATRRQSDWIVKLAFHDGDIERTAEAHSTDVLAAAREASERLVVLLGKAPVLVDEEFSPPAIELFQRLESALFVDDFAAARRLIESAPAAVRELPDMQLHLAQIESATDHDAPARERVTKLLSNVSAEGAPVLRARALTVLGSLDTLNVDASLRAYGEAIELLRKQNEPVYLGTAYRGRAVTYSVARKFSVAKSDYAQARVMFTLANNALQLAHVDTDEAALDADFGRPADALPLFERAAATMERFGAVDKLVTPVCNQMLTHLELLQPAEALSVYRRMRPKVVNAASQESLHFLDYLGAVSLGSNGRLGEARALLASVSAATEPVEEAGLRARIGAFLAELDLADGKIDQAVASASKSVDDLTRLHRTGSARANAWLTLTRALRVAGNAVEAQAQTRQFAESVDDQIASVSLRARLAEAEQYWNTNRRSMALTTYQDAARAADKEGTPYEIRVVAESYAGALLDAGMLEDASAVVGRVERWSATDFNSALLEARLYRALGQSDAWRTALDRARTLAGERNISAEVLSPPTASLALVQSQR